MSCIPHNTRKIFESIEINCLCTFITIQADDGILLVLFKHNCSRCTMVARIIAFLRDYFPGEMRLFFAVRDDFRATTRTSDYNDGGMCVLLMMMIRATHQWESGRDCVFACLGVRLLRSTQRPRPIETTSPIRNGIKQIPRGQPVSM